MKEKKGLFFARTVLLATVLSGAPFFNACKESDRGLEKEGQQRIGRIVEEEDITYIWSVADLALSKYNTGREVEVSTHIVYPKVPDGSSSITYKSYKAYEIGVLPPPYGMPHGLTFAYEFENFTNMFVYEHKHALLPIGAQTYRKNDQKLVAEAFIKEDEIQLGEKQEFYLHEVHYASNGNIIFRAKSEMDSVEGVKIREIETEGQKEDEYYFLWPSLIY